MTPETVARIVERRDEAEFVDLLRAAELEFEDPTFEASLADAIRAEPHLNDLWDTWSGDQRWTPSAYIEGREVGWFDKVRDHVRLHLDEGDAAADFIHRMAAWVARREVMAVDAWRSEVGQPR